MYRILALTLLLVSAGCITLPDESVDSASTDADTRSPLPPQATGTMTAEETVEDGSAGPCINRGISLPGLALSCITRTITVAGELDLASLPVGLATSSTDIAVAAGEEGSWSLVLLLESAGPTAAEARRGLDTVSLIWSHETPTGYALEAEVQREQDPSADVRADLALLLPPSVVYGLTIGTSSGDVEVSGLRLRGAGIATSSGDIELSSVSGDRLFVSTNSGDVELHKAAFPIVVLEASSGDLDFDLEGASLTIGTSSGDITGSFSTTATGTIEIGSSSGDIELDLAESARRGYQLQAATTSGDIEIGLRDGKAEVNEDEDRASFVTDGFARRDIRTIVTLSATSGDITVAPGARSPL